MRAVLIPIALATLAACSPRPAGAPKTAAAAPETKAAPAVAKAPREAPAGVYTLDPEHTSVVFRVPHMGLSRYTARFTRVDGQLTFDPANPAAQSVTATIDAGSLATSYPDPAKLDFDAQVEKEFLDAAKHPQITFRSTKVEPTGAETARVTGDLTLHGVTRPVVLEVTYNGGYKGGGMDPNPRIGFSAHGSFKRSDFGIAFGVPAPGTTFGVGDDVEVIIETEFTKPAG
ncbi:MAG: polyisoprenoid-binding protein [Phenylobacterium sp.]|uniref:YceI family protein n=1 Tax=Phenylobacterium sp. TaxID=1871053 RepID=UPI00122139D6|nr:YceI family protein [Phenylobacterium sp.]TAJ71897.1 MAG: polyisoprenoid-binding protein [Phenylobacterium sp.]